jgi:NDP-sugar pyrophosphorylase family protein
MLRIVIPMAGRGKRFVEAGYKLPKPLIPVHGRPMIQLVVNNIAPTCEHQFIFLCLKEHIEEYAIDKQLREMVPNCEIVNVDKVTEGAACTVLLAKELINNDEPLMIANCDQWIDVNIDDYLENMNTENADGLIMTMWADDPKWSYVRLNSDNIPIEVVEKQVVSNEATVGIYNYRHGCDFVLSAESMIEKNLRVNNEFYVAPAYNEMIKDGKRLALYNIGRENDGMYGIGLPQDLIHFEENAISKRAVSFD